MLKKISKKLLEDLTINSDEKHKGSNRKRDGIFKWLKRNIVSISLVALLLISVTQTVQLAFIYSNLDNSNGASATIPASLDSLPNMVGGC